MRQRFLLVRVVTRQYNSSKTSPTANFLVTLGQDVPVTRWAQEKWNTCLFVQLLFVLVFVYKSVLVFVR